ncbi:uncharacterized protein [Watersipora subatra]|uniref:uncharacterized protein n=1 Tax=Watersipora subatra TaxID=2589382 RepID=UPI00355B2133
MKVEPIGDGPVSHPCTLHGCVQILEMISTTVGLICCLLNQVWLTEAGGGFVAFTLICCFIFSTGFMVIHLIQEKKDWIQPQLAEKLPNAEWIGYICGLVLLIISLIVAILGSSRMYIYDQEDGRKRLVESSPITVTAVFVTLAMLYYLMHVIQLSLARLRNGGKSKPNSKAGK